MKINRDEVYNTLIQIYNDETHDEIILRLDLIEFINKKSDRSLSFLINQDIMELLDMEEWIKKMSSMNKYLIILGLETLLEQLECSDTNTEILNKQKQVEEQIKIIKKLL
tara:strand:+ start:376 stop:705 length:330 start_codon:yes stop_codon:yes gene_type:complete